MLQLDVQAIATHLRASVPAFTSVGMARDFGAVKTSTLRFPSAWVILLAEVAGEARYANGDMIEQAITARIGVIMAVRDIADRDGARASLDLKTLREATLLCLGRHVPSGADQAFRFAKGALQSGISADGALFWQDDFTLRYDRRIQIT